MTKMKVTASEIISRRKNCPVCGKLKMLKADGKGLIQKLRLFNLDDNTRHTHKRPTPMSKLL